MKKFLYFADGDGADATGDAIQVLADSIAFIEPQSTTTTAIFCFNANNTQDEIILTHDDTSATTGHRVKDISKAVAEAANSGPHTNGMVDMVDLTNSIFYGNLSFVTGVAIDRGSNTAGITV